MEKKETNTYDETNNITAMTMIIKNEERNNATIKAFAVVRKETKYILKDRKKGNPTKIIFREKSNLM